MTQEKATPLNRITQDPAVMVGKPVVRGTRIPVDRVLAHLANNPALEDLFAAFPELTIDDVKAVLAYAQDLVESSHDRPAARDGEERSTSNARPKSPQDFYKRLTQRADIREILTQLAK